MAPPAIARLDKPGKQNIFSDARTAKFESVLEETKDYEDHIEALLSPLKRYELQDLFFRTRLPNGEDQYFNVYRNSDFVSDVEFIISDTIPEGEHIVRNVKFGYQNLFKDKVQVMGTIKAIEFDEFKNLKRVYLSSEKQREMFKAHFLGTPFSPQLRASIVNINTAVFKELSEIPEAQKKVSDFEKARGWPEGASKKMGLVYYSTDVFDIKKWAMKNFIKFDDIVQAGWMHKNMGANGRINYRENYNNSIKIPLMDTEDTTKVAMWRTRNLVSNPKLPKYLSWPKDRSLYEEAPLFEEFYNSWNLNKVKGKPIVITEGEFKCAIGEMTTGIFHLGLPGITQFSRSMLEQIVKAQPSDVIVLFDRDTIGKGLVRLDEVTDSQRASYFIAKQIEAAGIPVKVSSLPDVFSGKKVGIDDLILAHGPLAYLTSISLAKTPDEYARTNHIDVTATQLFARRGRVIKALMQFRKANSSTLGFVTLEQRRLFELLSRYEDVLDRELRFYMKTKYPGRRHLTVPSHQFDIIYLSGNGPQDQLSTEKENFLVDGPLLKINLKASNVKGCANKACFEINRTNAEWKNLDAPAKYEQLSSALEPIFPLDEYTFIASPRLQGRVRTLLVIRKESRSPVAIVDEILTLPN